MNIIYVGVNCKQKRMNEVRPDNDAPGNTSNSGWIPSDSKNFKSVSKNTGVLLLYDYILAYQLYDTDFWDSCGNDYLIAQMQQFKNADWKELELDLRNWTIEQVGILSNCLIEGNNEKEDVILPEREYLAGHIATIIGDKDIHVFLASADFFINGNNKPKGFLITILETLKRLKYDASSQGFWLFKEDNFQNYVALIETEIEKAGG